MRRKFNLVFWQGNGQQRNNESEVVGQGRGTV